VHESLDEFTAGLKMLMNAPLTSADSAMLVVLGLGLLLRDCKHAMEYEEDEAASDAPSYLANSVLNIACITKVDSAGRHVLCRVVGLIEAAMPVAEGFEEDKENDDMVLGNEDKGKGKGKGNVPMPDIQQEHPDDEAQEEGNALMPDVQQKCPDDEAQDEENAPMQGIQEGQEDEMKEEEFKQTGKKRSRAQASGNTLKKPRVEDLRRSDRPSQPSKKAIEARSRKH
jgi:hypothetical protein